MVLQLNHSQSFLYIFEIFYIKVVHKYCMKPANSARLQRVWESLHYVLHTIVNLEYSDPSLYRASPIAASLLRGIFYSAFFTVNPDWLRGFTVV